MHDEVDAQSLRSQQRVSFSEFMDMALYGEEGYYQRAVKIGGDGADFYTAAQSPLFSRSLARYALERFESYHRPDVLQVVELGAGQGEMAAEVAMRLRALLPAHVELNYVIVERSEGLTERQQQYIADHVKDAHITWRWGKPDNQLATVILANEVLDALPVERVRRNADGWKQGFVQYNAQTESWQLLWDTPRPEVEAFAERWLDIPLGTEAEACLHYDALFTQCATFGQPVSALFIDYGIIKEEWQEGVRPRGTIRAYRRHEIVDVFSDPGKIDMTADVYWDVAEVAASKAGFTQVSLHTQGSFLMNHGIVDELTVVQQLSNADPLTMAKWTGQLKHLVLPGGMGERFSILECLA